MADHGQLVFKRAASMNVAVAAAHWSVNRPEISSNYIKQGFAKCRTSGLIANQRTENIALFLLQKHSAGGADCFLAFAKIYPAHNHAAAVQACQLLLENAG